MKLTKDEAGLYGKRGAARRRADHRFLIEGESISVPEIAERLGIDPTTVRKRLRKARDMDGPITWEKLK